METHPDFSDDCDRHGFIGSILNPPARATLSVLEEAYNKNPPSKPRKVDSIPRIIHQIWIGTQRIPEAFKGYMEGWRRMHPGWDYRLWTDRELAQIKHRFRTQAIFDEMNCLGQKVDLARAELLNLFGGLYVDCDYECLKPVDEIHERYDFYSTLRIVPLFYLSDPERCPSPIVTCNSLIGARSSHPILVSYLDKVAELHRGGVPVRLRLSERFGLIRLSMSIEQLQRMNETLLKTYRPFHDTVLEHLSSEKDCNVVLPATIFNPIDTFHSWRWLNPRYWWRRLWFFLTTGKRSTRTYERPLPHTYTVHHSQGTWLFG